MTTAVQANLRSAERQQELDQRARAGRPSSLQIGYLVLAVLGLLGVPVSRAWWQRIWPPEVAAEYAGRTGYWAAWTVRALAYSLVFLPLTAVVAAPYSLFRQIWDGVMTPVRWWRRLRGRRRRGAWRSAERRTRARAGTGRSRVATPDDSGAATGSCPEAARRLGNTRPSR